MKSAYKLDPDEYFTNNMFPYGIVQFRLEKKHSISFEAVVWSLIKEIYAHP